ncbi:hypothetical protein FISHEDRAFT_61316 [Fistulina hepatica ATCC 64428]|uniref:Response regulatory domain-containing protein n=1 Tax=Fistulina hepatica ATCC 64428 TaxID=1128425 RepID=A0A0D7A324_9AGAR|nr:hypothetical protein FISHEDRAFT_61316 [Fistulina hepatica ATCC 64428]
MEGLGSRLPAVRIDPASNDIQYLPATGTLDSRWPSSRDASWSAAFGNGGLENGDNDEEEPQELTLVNTPPAKTTTSRQLAQTLATPAPSQLKYLSNPYRPSPIFPPRSVAPDHQLVRELAVELADVVQMIAQTLVQVSPPQLLDQEKESISACSVSVPSTAISAIFTASKYINYLSAHMSSYIRPSSPTSTHAFDIGEALQNAGDSLAGVAGEAGVDLVIFHADVSLHHEYVEGDEIVVPPNNYSEVIRSTIHVCRKGDTIELGLSVKPTDPSYVVDGEVDDEYEGPCECVIEISHKFRVPEDGDSTVIVDRPLPVLQMAARTHLENMGVKLTANVPVPRTFVAGRRSTMSNVLPRVRRPAGERVDDTEPSLTQLRTFMKSLKGRKATLYASSHGSFAHYVTSYLTAWGMDVNHVSGLTGDNVEVPASPTFSPPQLSTLPPETYGLKVEVRQPTPEPSSFIIIDEDLEALGERLEEHRRRETERLSNHMQRSGLTRRRTMSRPPHSSRVSNVPKPVPPPPPPPAAVIVHFTSLSNFKYAKELMYTCFASYPECSSLPEVMILPKPVGPRRFLTALHTATTKPVVDRAFTPLATAPISPGAVIPLYSRENSRASSPRSSPILQRPNNSRTNSERSMCSPVDVHERPPPLSSPLANRSHVDPFSTREDSDYFSNAISDAAARHGTSPSSGVVVQTPDGQARGIYFAPQLSPSSTRIDGSHPRPSPKQKPSRPSPNPPPLRSFDSFSSLHEQQMLERQEQQHEMLGLGLNVPASSSSGSFVPQRTDSKDDELLPPSSSTSQPTNNPSRTDFQSSAMALSPMKSPNSSASQRRQIPVRRISRAQGPQKTPIGHEITPPINVLIVEDNYINQTIVSTFMKKKGINSDTAKNGREAVEKWQNGSFHLILMDIQMPVMSGIQATQEIRRIENERAGTEYITPGGTSTVARTPHRSSVIIVALTAGSKSTDRLEALKAGCNDFLTKPVNLHWLNKKVIEWGSIKALQLGAKDRATVNVLLANQERLTRGVASRLALPVGQTTPSPSRAEPEHDERRGTSPTLPIPRTQVIAPSGKILA